MGFSDKVKTLVKEKAHYRCCICEKPKFLHIHHIISIKEGGSDLIDNAAQLCVDCHDKYGHNEQKRKWIKEKRDFWYEFCNVRINKEIEELFDKYTKLLLDASVSTISTKSVKISDLWHNIIIFLSNYVIGTSIKILKYIGKPDFHLVDLFIDKLNQFGQMKLLMKKAHLYEIQWVFSIRDRILIEIGLFRELDSYNKMKECFYKTLLNESFDFGIAYYIDMTENQDFLIYNGNYFGIEQSDVNKNCISIIKPFPYKIKDNRLSNVYTGEFFKISENKWGLGYIEKEIAENLRDSFKL